MTTRDTSTDGEVVSINVSRSGVPKHRVDEATVSIDGIEGDGHEYRQHGGPDRAVVLYSLDLIERLRAEGHPIGVGTTGENVTVSGVQWDRLTPGVRVGIGEVTLQITAYTTPCATIRGSFIGGDISRISQKPRPGWSRVCARVLTAGVVRIGDAVTVYT